MATTPVQMLQELEPLTHNARIERVIELGRQASKGVEGTGGTDAAAILAAWEQGEYYERWLALYSCFGSRDSAHVLRSCADPSRLIRGLACNLAAFVCNDVQIRKLLPLVSGRQQIGLLRELYKRHRYPPVDAFLHELAENGNYKRLAKLVGFGSAAVVTAYINHLLQYTSANDLKRLAGLHPEILLSLLQAQAERATELDVALTWRVNAVLPLLAETHPDRILTIVTVLARYTPLTNLQLQPLLAKRPNELAELILNSDDRVHLDFNGVAPKLDLDRLQRLIERDDAMLNQHVWWFHRLPPAQRLALYERYARGWYDANECLPLYIVAALPREQRNEEARRHLHLPILATRPDQRLPYAEFLPWDEALTVLTPFIQNPDSELRALALKTLLSASRFQRDRLTNALALVHARRNEQDPVRLAMLTALAELPPGIWQDSHLAALAEIFNEALDAADLSYATAHVVGKLVFLLLPRYPDWGVTQLVILARQHGRLSGHVLEQHLSDTDVQRLAPALLPVLHEWNDRDRVTEIFALASALGKRLRVFAGLLDILRSDVERWGWRGEAALSYIANDRYEMLHTLVPQVIKKDPSWVTRPLVYTYLHSHRQDLLTPFLGQKAYKGLFSTGSTRFVLPLTSGFYRWTPAQQRIFAMTLTDVTRDTKRDNPTLFRIIGQLAALPAVPPTRLIELASKKQLATRDTALRALGQLDDTGRGLPTLLDALNDDRARIAIYVLRRAVLDMPARQAISLLKDVPLQRVTVAKEVLRLLGELETEEAYALLLQRNAQEDLHRDVRIALLRALWSHLHRDETWEIMQRAAQSPDTAIAKSVARIPSERLSLSTQQRLLAVLAQLLQHPDPEVRQTTLERCHSLPVTDADNVLFPHILTALTSYIPDEQSAAARAIFATYTGKHAPAIGKAITTLLPRHKALQNTISYLELVLRMNKRLHLPTAYTVLNVLEQDALVTRLHINIAILSLPVEELIVYFTRLVSSERFHAGLLAYTCTQLEGVRNALSVADLTQMEQAFRSSTDERLRRFAFAVLVALSCTAQGWSEERLALHRHYRSDPAPLVAEVALFTPSPLDNGVP